MSKLLIRAVVILLVCACASLTVPAQLAYSVPQAIDLDKIVRRNFKSFFVRAYLGGPIQQLHTEGFYPIGWSRDGKFAYYLEPVDEECGCYFAELIIQDLKTDKILWHFKHDWRERMDAEGKPLEDDLGKLWERNQKMFAGKLREYAIEQVDRFILLPITFRFARRSYTARITVRKGRDEDGLGRARNITLSLISPGFGTKTLYSETNTNDMYGAPLDAGLAGVLTSPFENRAAIVMLKVQRGWEGPPHTVSVQIAGADLQRGFR